MHPSLINLTKGQRICKPSIKLKIDRLSRARISRRQNCRKHCFQLSRYHLIRGSPGPQAAGNQVLSTWILQKSVRLFQTDLWRPLQRATECRRPLKDCYQWHGWCQSVFRVPLDLPWQPATPGHLSHPCWIHPDICHWFSSLYSFDSVKGFIICLKGW